MSIIKIDGGPLAGYNGELVGVIFEDGVSTSEIPQPLINRLAAVTAITMVETGLQAGVAADLVRFKGESFEEEFTSTETESEIEPEQGGEEIGNDGEPESDTGYSQEELESIADKSGIAGVREIGDKFGVKGTSISGIISGILEAQRAG